MTRGRLFLRAGQLLPSPRGGRRPRSRPWPRAGWAGVRGGGGECGAARRDQVPAPRGAAGPGLGGGGGGGCSAPAKSCGRPAGMAGGAGPAGNLLRAAASPLARGAAPPLTARPGPAPARQRAGEPPDWVEASAACQRGGGGGRSRRRCEGQGARQPRVRSPPCRAAAGAGGAVGRRPGATAVKRNDGPSCPPPPPPGGGKAIYE